MDNTNIMEQNYDLVYLELLDSDYPIDSITVYIVIYKNTQLIELKISFCLEKDFNQFILKIYNKDIYTNYTFSEGIRITLYNKNYQFNYLELFDFIQKLKFPPNVNTIKLLTQLDKDFRETNKIIEILKKEYGYDFIKLNFPINLIQLVIEDFNIYNMDNLPTSLKILDLSKTHITNGLDWLPSSLETLHTDHKMVSWFKLENLPSSLKSIYIGDLFFDSTQKFIEHEYKENKKN